MRINIFTKKHTKSIYKTAIFFKKFPIADAGVDRAIGVGTEVALDGSGSSDPEGRELTYSWEQVPLEGVPMVTLSPDNTAQKPTFKPEYLGQAKYIFRLTVNNGIMDSDWDEVIYVTGMPIAVAGDDLQVSVGETVRLDGISSQESPNCQRINKYKWELVNEPDGSNLIIKDTFNEESFVEFIPEVAGIYRVKLQVKDLSGFISPPDEVTITVVSTRSSSGKDLDTDDDGLSDDYEDTIKYDGKRKTDKTLFDSDFDGISDGVEVGLTESKSLTIWTDRSVFKSDADSGDTTTDPTLKDTDGDKLNDGEEDGNFDGKIEGDNINYDIYAYGTWDQGEEWKETDPDNKDTDGDELLDGYDIDNQQWGELSPHIAGPYRVYIDNWKIEFKGTEVEKTNNLNADTDSDGLRDSFEIGYYFKNVYEIALWDSIPIFEKPNPIEKDIYVELDWMESCYEYKKSFWDEICFLGLIFGSNEKITINHNFPEESRTQVINVFRDHGIDLHIDDGTKNWKSIGQGEGNIHHIDVLYRENLFLIPHFNDYYHDGNYFSEARRGKFHYGILGHYTDDIIMSNDEYKGIWGCGSLGTPYKHASEDFFIASGAIRENRQNQPGSYSTHIAHNFMHEIGHNFGLEDNTGACMDYSTEGVNTVDYTPEQWDIVLNTLPINQFIIYESLLEYYQ
jgi:hypothetical protein